MLPCILIKPAKIISLFASKSIILISRYILGVHPSCKISRKFRVGWVDGSIHIISKECIISSKFLQKALVWLSYFDGELR